MLHALPPVHRAGGGGDRRLELRHVGRDRGWIQTDRVSIGYQHRAGTGTGRFELVPERGEGGAQTLTTGFDRNIRPQELDEQFPPVRLVPVKFSIKIPLLINASTTT